ncbi:TonB-dependent receptor [Novosphingobium aquimarinum]|uniref:TonB-dependent receptor n=1 Tax=Novosphingobium aquimarinum TaxID=2682494 RepID=UPI001E2C2977|nr:TonB-dependent receptor [Novosphingobium aquimarinum]
MRSAALCTVAVVVLADCAPAMAQAASAGVTDAPMDIVVTAERRETTVQQTPISIGVFDGEDLIKRDVTTLEALSRVAPDISFTQADGQPIIAIRGISSQNTGAVGDPAIAVSTDGFYLNRPYALTASFYDLERIEVLRGPQGTLNGRNANGGAINILTVRPQSEFGGFATAQYGNYNAVGIQGALNVPLSDTAKARVSFLSRTHDFYRDTPPQEGGDDENTQSIRGQILLTPTDRLKIWALAQYNFIGGSPGVAQNIPFVFDADGTIVHDLPSGINDETFTAGVPNYTRMNEHTFKWSAEYDLDAIKITYLGGYDDTSYRRQDDDSNNGKVYGFRMKEKPRTWNQELRVSSGDDSRLFWQVGVFYFNEKNDLFSAEYYAQPGGTYARGYTFDYHVTSKSLAGFGQASYKITDQLTATAGIRYTHDKKRRSGLVQFADDDVPVDPVSYFTVYQDNSGTWNKVTYQAGLDYQVTPRNMVYAKIATGYKSGGFVPLATYKPETVTSYEVGSKNRFAGNLLQLNLAFHFEDYKDQQVSQLATLPDGGVATLIRNAGSSHIYGLETDLVLTPARTTRITASVNYLHARFEDFETVQDGVNVQLAGRTPPNAPDWSIGLGAEQDIPLASGTLTLSADSKYQSAQYFSYFNFDSTRQKAYTMSNASVTYAPDAANWSVSLYANNIEDRRVFTNAVENAFTQSYHYSFYAPRTYGGRVTLKW